MNQWIDGSDKRWRYQVPIVPYERPDKVLYVPTAVIEKTLEIFDEYALRKVEACCFWYGLMEPEQNGTVVGIVVPTQLNQWGHYKVYADAMAEVARQSRPMGWKNLAQIHTHPTDFVTHSLYDDEHANSRQAMSLVFPHYGLWDDEWPIGIGVHEFQSGYWHQLSNENAIARVQVVEQSNMIQVLDLR